VAGSSGLGRQNRQMNGHIPLAYSLVGFRKSLPTTNTLISVANGHSTVSCEQLFESLTNRYHVVHTC
jgi:hypothetical protein